MKMIVCNRDKILMNTDERQNYFVSRKARRGRGVFSDLPFAMNRETTQFMAIPMPDCVDISQNKARKDKHFLCLACGLERSRPVFQDGRVGERKEGFGSIFDKMNL